MLAAGQAFLNPQVTVEEGTQGQAICYACSLVVESDEIPNCYILEDLGHAACFQFKNTCWDLGTCVHCNLFASLGTFPLGGTLLPASEKIGWKLLLTAALISSVAGCQSDRDAASSEVQLLDIEVREVLTIGNNAADSVEYLFGFPEFVVTDSRGRIYVADGAVMNVRVFDPEGRYEMTIGRRGRGPQEFMRFGGMGINLEDELIVMDRTNARVTRISPEGAFLASHSMIFESVMQIRPYEGGYLTLNNEFSTDGNVDHLFRGYDADFAETGVVFGRADDVVDTEEMIEQIALTANPGSFVLTGNRILYAPSLYNGVLYGYSDGGGKWTQTHQIQGHVSKPAYSKVGRNFEDHEVDMILFIAGERVGALSHNFSLGLFRLRNQDIVHFTFCDFGSERIFGMELFDQRGNLTAYGSIERVPLDAHGTAALELDIAWKDDQDRLYIIDRTETPVIRVVEVQYGPESE